MGIGTHKSSTNFHLQVSGISPELVCKVGNLALDGVEKMILTVQEAKI